MFAAAANRADAVKVLLEGGADAGAMTRVFDLMEVAIPPIARPRRTPSPRRSASGGGGAASGPEQPEVAGVDRRYEYHELVAAQGGLTRIAFRGAAGASRACKRSSSAAPTSIR